MQAGSPARLLQLLSDSDSVSLALFFFSHESQGSPDYSEYGYEPEYELQGGDKFDANAETLAKWRLEKLLANDRWQFGKYGAQNVGNWIGEFVFLSLSLSLARACPLCALVVVCRWLLRILVQGLSHAFFATMALFSKASNVKKMEQIHELTCYLVTCVRVCFRVGAGMGCRELAGVRGTGGDRGERRRRGEQLRVDDRDGAREEIRGQHQDHPQVCVGRSRRDVFFRFCLAHADRPCP